MGLADRLSRLAMKLGPQSQKLLDMIPADQWIPRSMLHVQWCQDYGYGLLAHPTSEAFDRFLTRLVDLDLVEFHDNHRFFASGAVHLFDS